MAAMSSTGTTTSSSSGLRAPASTIVTSRSGPMPPRKRAIVSSGRWVADRPMRWGGFVRSGSRRCSRRSRRQGEVGAALGPGDRVDLVDDDVLDAAQDLARLAREQQVQALGGRDEDVGRVAGDLATVLAGRVAGAARDGDPRRLVAELLRGQADAGQRRAQVAFHVVGQRLERGDVEDPDVAGVRRGLPAGWGRGRGGRGRRGTRRGSCRCRSGRGSACARRGRWPPSRGTGPRSGPRSSPRTRPERRARRVRADRRRWSLPRTSEYRVWTLFRPSVRYRGRRRPRAGRSARLRRAC